MQTTTAYRTWNLIIPVYLEGAWQMNLTCTVQAFHDQGIITAAIIDGEEATADRAAHLLGWARAEGTLDLLDTSEDTRPATLTRRAASALHADLGRLGYTHDAHYEIASAATGRDLASLTELTDEEATTVWAHACLVRGYSTPVTRYYGRAVAA
ncbi:hypothetical protein [Deinococcus aquiradiocola]|uniref:Uncharacterized protein n=1 Tax=Deinococcus aquiradiocola TaxID=393059 RepID=A0A917P7U7_9DEIO|nr:hypothetical protein [Deinococcus aquiradiocola]GGJ65516.1 hypothetical protein GCM10008939_06860 [Deinococcus aquiradiocola]